MLHNAMKFELLHLLSAALSQNFRRYHWQKMVVYQMVGRANWDNEARMDAYEAPSKWSFNSHTVMKNSEQAPRTPAFAEEIIGGENVEGEEGIKPPEKSLWAKYWMYLIPLGLIVMNAVTQAMNMPEEQAAGQSGSQAQQPTAAVQRGPNPAVRRRG